MTKSLRLQTGLSDGSNSPTTNIDGSNTENTDWVPFYIEEAEEKEESDKSEGYSEEGGTGNGGQGGVGLLQGRMGEEPTSMDAGGALGNYIKPELPQLVPSRPPGLLPIPGRGDPRGEPLQPPATGENSNSQDTKQVQAAMAMAAIYSQSPWAAIAMAQQRERLQQQMHATVPHPAAQAAAAAAAAGSAPRSLPPSLPMGLPGLPAHIQGLPGAQQILEHSRQQDLIRDYLTKLAQSTLNVTTSMGTAPGPTSPQYLQSFSTSTTADSKTEKPLPATVRRSLSPASSSAADQISSTSRKSPPPASMAYGSPYFPSVSTSGGGHGHPYFSAMRHTSPTEPPKPMSTTTTRSPPSGGRRNGSSTNGREKVFTCNICNRSFGYKHVLQNHERTHTGEKPFECKECHKRFTRDHHLKTHMRLHTGEKPYSCTHCDRQFVQVANLRRHLRVHTGERPYKCELCPSNFSDSNQLKAHMLIHKGRLESAAASERRAAHAKATSEEEMRMRLKMILTPCTTEGASQRVADLHRPNFANLKEELFFRHSLATGFPLPQYPPPPSLAALNTSTGPIMAQEEMMSQASLSPDSKDTESAHDSPGHGENLSDSNSEKRRSRKQKPRKMVWGSGGEGSPEEGETTRDRHVSSSSFRSHSMQQEPEDLSVRTKADEEMLEDVPMGSELPYVYRLAAAQAGAQLAVGEKRNRSEGSDGSLASFSDPQSSSLLKEEGTEEEKEMMEDERGVSPPMSSPHPNLYSPFPIQLGLSGAAVPLTHEMREREGEIMAMVGKKQEISQQ